MRFQKGIIGFIGIFLFSGIIQHISPNEVRAYDNISPLNKVSINRYANYKPSSSSLISSTSPVYIDIFNAITNVQDIVDLTKYNISSGDDVFSVLSAVLDDHPELYYFSYNGTLLYSNGSVMTTLKLAYAYTKEECLSKKSTLEKKINSILSSIITPQMTELEKEINIHDYIIENATYDIERLNNNTLTEEDYTVWGILINGTGVCDGYAKALKLLLNRVGIECIRVVSPAMNHAWNIVKINGKNYHVDATWDDPLPETNRRRYYYFNLSDDEISDSYHEHQWDTSLYPKCTSTDLDYLMKLGDLWDYTRSENTIYYFTSNELKAMDIDGTNQRDLYSNIYGYSPAVFGDSLFYIYYNGISKLNLNTGVEEEILNQNVSNLYIKEGILHAEISGQENTSEYILNLVQKQDINVDGYVNIKDLVMVAKLYNKTKLNLGENWDAKNDINDDGIINIFDLVLISKGIS